MGTESQKFPSRREVARQAHVAKELLLWGGDLREQLLLRLLEGHYESLFRRLWLYGEEAPHFTNHRIGSFRFSLSRNSSRPEYFFRGFFSSELLRASDVVLDIGCGDGFFTKRFFGPRSQAVDGIDIDAGAIKEATKINAAPNVRYHLTNAVTQPFPRPHYDVVVWDGAIGHFSADDTDGMLRKIKDALGPGGVFTGSESLGREEGHDHLQFFDTLGDFATLFRRYWKHVHVRDLTYPLTGGTFTRREAYWRCSDDESRVKDSGWTSFSG